MEYNIVELVDEKGNNITDQFGRNIVNCEVKGLPFPLATVFYSPTDEAKKQAFEEVKTLGENNIKKMQDNAEEYKKMVESYKVK